jgi:hypothetical protein
MVTNLHEFLTNNNACDEAKLWASNKSWNEIYNTCHRGDWLLWLFQRTNPNDLQVITLAKAHCANTVRHLINDERSKNAIDVAIAFVNGNATREELNAAYADADAAAVAYNTAADTADDAAAYAAYAAADTAADAAYAVAYNAAAAADAAAYAAAVAYNTAADTAADAAAVAYNAAAYAAYADTAYADTDDAAYAVAYNAAADARTKNQLETADICRQYLPIEIWNIVG